MHPWTYVQLPRTQPDPGTPAPPHSRAQVFNLKFTAKQLARSAVKCEKEEKAERLKVGWGIACRGARRAEGAWAFV